MTDWRLLSKVEPIDLMKIEMYWMSNAGHEFGYTWFVPRKDTLGSYLICGMDLFGWTRSAAIMP